MAPNLRSPITYLITSGATTANSSQASKDFQDILTLVSAAVSAGVSLVQLREKNLSAKVLYKLAVRCSAITANTGTRLLVNDSADIAQAAGADGVHLTSRSIDAIFARSIFGERMLIGVSVHSVDEALRARDGADFVVFGPVFETPSKRSLGSPVGPGELGNVVRELAPLPVIAIGGITLENVEEVLRAGARGIAAIRLFSEPTRIEATVTRIQEIYQSIKA